jgi:hypothetical protein
MTTTICGTVTQACTMTELHEVMSGGAMHHNRIHNVDGSEVYAALQRMHFVLMWSGEGHLGLTAL